MTSKINGGQIDSYAPLARPSATPAGKSGGVPAHTDVPTSRGDSLSLTRDAQLLQLGASAANESSEEHTSELQSLMRILYAVFCWKKKISSLVLRMYIV